jgi:hypothetical protein
MEYLQTKVCVSESIHHEQATLAYPATWIWPMSYEQEKSHLRNHLTSPISSQTVDAFGRGISNEMWFNFWKQSNKEENKWASLFLI